MADDRFDVRFSSDAVTSAELLAAVRALGYEPEVVARPADAVALPTKVDVASLEGSLREAFQTAANPERPVLVVFRAPG